MILTKQGEKEVYSDTLDLEKEMMEIAEEYPEDLSQDYIGDDNRYTVNNTFSSVRRNLLNWYKFKDGATVLEVGAGMGALTGCLCDKCKDVVALEMSEVRATVIRKRYPERQNLSVVCDDIFTWKTEKKFDYVVVVGVLEYASIFGKQYSDPFFTFIERIKSFLKENGTILLAIENRFGLKYWCGASEDHLCEPFKGIAGYQEKNTAVTFSKMDLKMLFKRSGFENVRFFNVLPDYKFPTLIYSEDYAPSISMFSKLNLNYVKGSRLIYNEKKLYKDVIDNNVGNFFANSFLVEATVNNEISEQAICIVSKGECKKEYRTSTLIYKDDKVEKVAMHEKAKIHLGEIKRYEQELKEKQIPVIEGELVNEKIILPFFHGKTAEEYFHELLLANDKIGIKKLFYELESCLKKSSDSTKECTFFWNGDDNKKDYGIILKRGYIDMTLSNSFFCQNKLIFFDQEWMFENIPLNFILFYSVRQSYLSFTGKSDITLESLYKLLNIEQFIDDFIVLEKHIWDKILYRQEHFYDGDGWYNQYDEEKLLSVDLKRYDDVENERNCLKYMLEEKGDYIAKLEKEIKGKNDYIAELEKEIKGKNDYIVKLEDEFKCKNDYIVHLEKEIKEKNAYIIRMEENLKI